jgi:hypothetical protein
MNLCRFSIFCLMLGSIATVSIASVAAQDRLFSNAAQQEAEYLLKQMTVDEKVGQLNESSGMLIPGFAIERPDDLIAKKARLARSSGRWMSRRLTGSNISPSRNLACIFPSHAALAQFYESWCLLGNRRLHLNWLT